jgi:3-oxoacyl-(acyl-carrier-protein) synthase
MNIYISSVSAITPASHPAESPFSNALVCADADLTGLLDHKLTRRMSHVIKMGVGTALKALQEAKISQPDAIITGTAYGCLDDTGIFLKRQIEQHESMLTPTAFIQSTHNTVGGQIGLLLHCHAYNNTFVHSGFSFEHALEDAVMMLHDGQANNVLVGAVDELTKTSHTILERFGLFKQNPASKKGYTGGEGAAFFVLTNHEKEGNMATLKNVTTLFKPSAEHVSNTIYNLLEENGLGAEDVDIIIEGKNCGGQADKVYDEVLLTLFGDKKRIGFKNESGEYPTAAAIALYKAANIARLKIFAGEQSNIPVKNILIYNHYQNIYHSIYLLQAC